VIGVAYLFKAHYGTDDSPRITAELQELGWRVSPEHGGGLDGARSDGASYAATAVLDAPRTCPPQGALRRFLRHRPGRTFVGWVTEIPPNEGTPYLAAVLDPHARRSVGFVMGAHHDAELARAALCGSHRHPRRIRPKTG
jgi:putative transposase